MPLHVVAVATGGGVFHTTRSGPPSSGSTGWTAWVPLPSAPAPVVRIDSALVTGELHVCAATTAGTLLHTFRNTAGVWQAFWGDVGNAAGLPSTTNEQEYVGMCGVGTMLHVCTTSRGRPRPGSGIQPAWVWPIFHATRSTGVGAFWSPFVVVSPGPQFPTIQTVFTEITCANVAGTVQMCALGYWNRELWHTIQLTPSPSESWQPFGNVNNVLNNSPQQGMFAVSVAGLGSNLHLCGLSSNGSIFHTIRMSVPPSWQNPEGSGQATWSNVGAEVGGVPRGVPTFVDCAGADGNLHVSCLTDTGAVFHTIRTSTPPGWQNPEGSGQAMWGDVGAVVGALGSDPSPFTFFTTAGV
jgi:hypothetical protein